MNNTEINRFEPTLWMVLAYLIVGTPVALAVTMSFWTHVLAVLALLG